MLERSTCVVLAQTLAERWWDTTHAFHNVGREMTIGPRDFHCMSSLRFDGVLISLEDKLVFWLGANLLGKRYATETIRYNDLEADFMHYP